MIRDVPLKEIRDNPFQPRVTFDPATIQSLADEIKAEGFWNGTLQGRRNAKGQIELVFGHRRLRALRLLRTPSVKIEILDLNDAQMALRSLEENLQREGLTDIEKADAVRKAVETERAARVERGESENGAVNVVAQRLGLDPGWTSRLCQISVSLDTNDRIVVEKSGISAKAAHLAKEWGGKEYVKTLAQQATTSRHNPSVLRPTEHTVAAMRRAVANAPEEKREQLKEDIIKGRVQIPEEAEIKSRRLIAAKARREKEPPPDLKIVIVGWTRELQDWNRKLREVEAYMDYIDEVPTIAGRFRDALTQLADTINALLKASR